MIVADDESDLAGVWSFGKTFLFALNLSYDGMVIGKKDSPQSSLVCPLYPSLSLSLCVCVCMSLSLSVSLLTHLYF
jgi:hypothetical protein